MNYLELIKTHIKKYWAYAKKINIALKCRFFTTVTSNAVKKGNYSGFESTGFCLNYFVVISRQVFICYK